MKFIVAQYLSAIAFIKNSVSKLFILSCLAFILFSVLSYLLLLNNADAAMNIFNTFSEIVTENGLAEAEGFTLAVSLFGNNLRSGIFSVLYGFIPFLFLPALSVVANSFVIGAVLAVYKLYQNIDIWKVVVFGILPHGIFEIPAIMLSISLGIYLCMFIIRRLIKKDYTQTLRTVCENIVRIFLTIIIPLLIIAALIEAFFTPSLLAHFL